MKIKSITLKEGFFERTIEFSDFTNMIYSEKNSAGKTTLVRALLYALGYSVSSTKGFSFDDMDFYMTIDKKGKIYRLYRHDSYLSIDDGIEEIDYSLPSDFHEVMNIVFDCKNSEVADNLLGAFYIDQDKGWALLNRGKVVDNILFNIEALIRGLCEIDCEEQLKELEAVNRQIKKYEYIYSISDYQKDINEDCGNLSYDTYDESINRKIEVLYSERNPIQDELYQIKNILRKNKLFVEYISEMKLTVLSNAGEEVPVTKETLIGFIDNTELLVARREILAREIEKINRKIQSLESQKNREEELFKVESIIQKFDSRISRIPIDSISIKNIIKSLKKERKIINEKINQLTKTNTGIIIEIYECISKYALELGIGETYIAQNKDYIFTNDLKSLSGTILHKIVFAFRLTYVKLIKEKTGIILPIIIDSPSGSEVKIEVVQEMLNIIQRDFSEHQLFVASIYDFTLNNKKVIKLKEKLMNDDIF